MRRSVNQQPIKSEADASGYAPRRDSDWTNPDPRSVQEALDKVLGVTNRAFDGFTIEDVDVTVVVDTGVIECHVQAVGGGDVTCRFDGVSHVLDCTTDGPCEVNLTAGTATVPFHNFIYILESAGVLTLTAGTGFPTTGFVAIAKVVVKTAALTAADGALKVHAYSDHLSSSDDQGLVAHVNSRMRADHARWVSGVVPSDLVVSAPDAYISTTAGIVRQLHRHTMPAIDMQTPDPVYVINDPTNPYLRITSFNDINQDASGNGINNKYLNLVLIGVISEATGDCNLLINLPTDVYTVEGSAIADNDQTAVYAIPDIFTGTAFLIARYTVQAKNSGAWSQSQKQDLRGLAPSSAAGGGGFVGDAHPVVDTTSLVHDPVDTTKTMRVDVEAVATGTQRVLFIPDADVNLALIALLAAVVADNAILRGDGGARGVQSSTATIGDDGVVSIPGLGTGGVTDYDLKVGNPADYGMVLVGDFRFGRTSFVAGAIDLDGAVLFSNMGGPVTGDIEFLFAESTGGSTRFALPKSGVGLAAYFSRSAFFAGPATATTALVTLAHWQALGIFHNLLCDTDASGADVGIQGKLEVEDTIYIDDIVESTTDAGVTVEGVELKDGLVDGKDVATLASEGFAIAMAAAL